MQTVPPPPPHWVEIPLSEHFAGSSFATNASSDETGIASSFTFSVLETPAAVVVAANDRTSTVTSRVRVGEFIIIFLPA
ncbi:hypothetical protein [Halorussus sp. MSC15.2]|uniref:hypothetical protein n=1 Tax=Halorussus sp. MSC15.2 TaxID=2283638 RepID=UPI0013D45482|nr:hypothetical protein [Halorussus sp. MSC15.2]NEU57682.1 hypothetical protein [Halorussus sp. MSC15.2]